MARKRTTTAAPKMSLSAALLAALRTCPACGAQVESPKCSCGARLKPRPVKDVIRQALATWVSPAGKSPAATASTQLLYMQRRGECSKPERGMVVAGFPKAAA